VDPSLRPPTSRLLQALGGNCSMPLPSSRSDSRFALMSREKRYGHCFRARRYSYAELKDAIKDFSHCQHLGEKNHANVYKGILLDTKENNQDVAIKRLAVNFSGKEFHIEILNIIGEYILKDIGQIVTHV